MGNERINNIINIDKDLANRLLKKYKSQYCIDTIDIFTGGKSTSNYKLNIKGLDINLVLKIYPKNNKVCEKDFTIYNKKKNTVPMPQIFYINTDHKSIPNDYCIMEYLDGVTLDEYVENGNKISNELAKNLGSTLALLHKSEYEKEGLLDSDLNLLDGLPPILKWYEYFLNGKAGERLESTTVEQIKKFIINNKDLLLEMTDKYVLSHGDFRPENIMIKDDKIIGLIDWEFSLSAPRYFDIGQFLRVERYVPEEVHECFIEGYNAKANYPVGEQWAKLSKLMDLANLLSLLDSKEDKPKLHSNMKSLAEAYMKYLTNN